MSKLDTSSGLCAGLECSPSPLPSPQPQACMLAVEKGDGGVDNKKVGFAGSSEELASVCLKNVQEAFSFCINLSLSSHCSTSSALLRRASLPQTKLLTVNTPHSPVVPLQWITNMNRGQMEEDGSHFLNIFCSCVYFQVFVAAGFLSGKGLCLSYLTTNRPLALRETLNAP